MSVPIQISRKFSILKDIICIFSPENCVFGLPDLSLIVVVHKHALLIFYYNRQQPKYPHRKFMSCCIYLFVVIQKRTSLEIHSLQYITSAIHSAVLWNPKQNSAICLFFLFVQSVFVIVPKRKRMINDFVDWRNCTTLCKKTQLFVVQQTLVFFSTFLIN